MEVYAECQICGNGYLLPFYGSDGTCVYFCNSCGSRFSGYLKEPTMNGVPIFAQMGQYTNLENLGAQESPEGSDLLESYRTLLEEHPPDPQEELIVTYHDLLEKNPTPMSGGC